MSDEEATKAEEPKVEEPKAEKPKAEEPKAEEPKAEEPKAGGAKAEGAKAEGAKEPSGGDKEGGRADKRSHSRSPDRRRRDRSRDRRERDRDRGRDRDRDRRDRDRDRDRGRDRTRRDSRSRSRSRDRSRRKKSRRSESESPKKSSKRSSNWDKPAPGMDANAAAAASVAAASASSVPQGFFGAAGAMNPMLNPLAGINPMLAQMMANMPGAASANPMILAQLLAQQAAAAAAGGANSVAAQQLSRKSRELYVGNIPLGTVNNQGLKEFFDTACEAAFGTDPQGFKPVVKAEINANGTFAFVEFRTPEIATQAMQLSGINMMGRELRLARPSGYVPPVGGDPSMSMNAGAGVASVLNANAAGAAGVAGLLGGGVGAAAGQDVKARKLYIGNLPLDLNVTEQTMMDFFNTAMLAAFPELKNTPGNPVEQVWMSGEKKFCFVTFRNEDEAMKGMQLDNIQLMGRPLRIGRPSDYVPPAGQAAPQPLSATGTNNVPLGSSAAAPAAAGADAPTSVVLRLTNTMTEAEVDDEEEYNDIKEDMLEECGKFGKVEALEMPKEGPGKTMVYIKFDSLESAGNGFKMLHGRSFETRVVEASYYPEDKFDASDFS